METIYGYLDRISYCDEESQFVVAKLKEKGKRELSTIVGNLVGINPGESIKLSGHWRHNPKYGSQFQVASFETIIPATARGIEKYLGSGLIKGIGPVMAKRIVAAFGVQALDIIEKNPAQLEQVNGIGTKRIAMITQAWEEHKEIKEIMVFLQGHGVSAALAARIFKCYGKKSISVVKDNPYRLAAEVRGIGFITADSIAQALGIEANSLMRVKEGILYVLKELMGEGHVYYPRSELLEKTVELLQVDRLVAVQALDALHEEARVIIEERTEPEGKEQEEAVYLRAFHTAELQLSRRLIRLQQEGSPVRPVNTEKALEWVEKRLELKLAAKQKEAIATALQEKILIITGGPGTGKTTLINAITRIFAALRLRILMAAPTGRAAKRMQESSGRDAMTIHRLLEFNPREGGFKKNQDNPLEADIVIVDEASMIDMLLMHHLLKAIPPQAILIMVGDVNQLPSVGPGNVLGDLIASGSFPVIELREIFRQSRQSKIISNAHRINAGLFPDIRKSAYGKRSDFYFIEEEDPEKVVEKIVHLSKRVIPARFGFHPVNDIQVLSPMHRGVAGAINLNVELQKAQNPRGLELNRGGRSFRVRDKVMQVVNNYDKEVYNGDIGWITRIDLENQELSVSIDGRRVNYDFSQLDELQLAYAISIHKSQGSEYPVVVMPVLTQHFMLLQRNLVYTGITRAKKLVIIIGTKKALAIAVKNNKTYQRYTRLCERIKLVDK